MIINGLQIDETEVLDLGRDGSVCTVSDLIDYVVNNPAEFRKETKFGGQVRSCHKGYEDRGECCCECDLQLKISVCKCAMCSKVEGYICIAEHRLEDNYSCDYRTKEHGICELFTERKVKKG